MRRPILLWAAVLALIVIVAIVALYESSDFAKCAQSSGDPDILIDYCTRVIDAGGIPAGVASYNRGNLYLNKGEFDRAVADYSQAIRLGHDHVDVFSNRAVAYENKGEFDRAIADYDQAIRRDPDNAPIFSNRGIAYQNKGDFDRAIADYSQAIQLDPDYVIAINGKAWLLATARDAGIRDSTDAVRLAREAVSLENNPYYRDTLAAAYAEAEQFDDAVAEQLRAIDMLRATGDEDIVDDFQSRLDLYRHRKPYRE